MSTGATPGDRRSVRGALPPPPAPYIERFGFTPKTIFVVLLAAVFCALSSLPGPSLNPLTPRMPYIGLALRPGAPSPPGVRHPRGLLLRLSSSLVPHVPPEVIPLSRQISGWRLDRARLLAAVAAYAPDVGVVEVEQDGSTHPITVSPQRRPWGPVAPS